MNIKKIRVFGYKRPKLIFNKKVFNCQIGSNGKIPSYKKKEGDLCTPMGLWSLESIFIRKEKIKFFKKNRSLKYKTRKITKDCGWCDDIKNKSYNRYIRISKLNTKEQVNYEFLYRKDNAYDLFVVINYNTKPVIKGKGSAIFLHCSFNDLRATKGCVAINKKNLLYLCEKLNPKCKIQIN